MPNITATFDQTAYNDARVFATRMAALQTALKSAQSTQNCSLKNYPCETVKAG
jgi:hypothetical protein